MTAVQFAFSPARPKSALIARSLFAPIAVPGELYDDVRKQLCIGYTAVALLVGGLGIWVGTAKLAGAVVAHGTVVVDSNIKKVQHPTGGVVGEIRVRDGDKVTVGDIVVRLDDTVTKSNLGVITSQLIELAVRQARLKAERDGAATFSVGEFPDVRATPPAIQEVLKGERTLFDSRRTGRLGQKAQLTERINQMTEEIGGVTAQGKAKFKEMELIGRELSEVEKLWAKRLTPLSKLTTMQRDAARVEGERSQLIASVAQARAKIAETRLQIIQLDQDLRTEVMKDLREAQGKEAELLERRIAAEDLLKRVDLRSPQTGTVHQLNVHTVGGVVSPSDPIMLIVPEGDALVIEAKIAPQDIDHVRVGQAAFIRFPAFNQRTTPEFNGTVIRIAADLTKDPSTGQTYFIARFGLTDNEVQRLGKLKLIPGMPAEVHVRTNERTAISYFIKPLRDQFTKAFTEH
jgi:HlyD family secretion protein